MPSCTRQRVYRPESPLPPPRKQRKVEVAPPSLNLLDLFHGTPIFDKIASFLGAYSLGLLVFVHSSFRARIVDKHWTDLLKCVTIPSSAATQWPLVPARLRLQLYSKLVEHASQMENLNERHFYIDDENRCRCRGRMRSKCKLPNLHTLPYTIQEIDGAYPYFCRLSYRDEQREGHHTVIWQGLVQRPGDNEPTTGMELVFPDELKDAWLELRQVLSFRVQHRCQLSNLGPLFGQYMRLLAKLHKYLSLTVIGMSEDDFKCHLVYASAGQTNLRRLQERRIDPHRTMSPRVDAWFHFAEGYGIYRVPTLKLLYDA